MLSFAEDNNMACGNNHGKFGMCRAFCSFFLDPRKKVMIFILLMTVIIASFVVISIATTRLQKQDEMEAELVIMQSHVDYLQSQYFKWQQDVRELQEKISERSSTYFQEFKREPSTTVSPDIENLLKNISGTKAATGIQIKNHQALRIPGAQQFLPHLMNDPNSLRPAYHMRGAEISAAIVVGIPTVKRDKETYLHIALDHLVKGLTEADYNNTLIVVMVGESDLEFVINTAKQIETLFEKEVNDGLIEVISPSASYYPDFAAIPDSLGDSHARVMWRTKQNLDAIFLMAYAQTKGTFFLMLEDDVIAKGNYIQEIKKFTALTTLKTPNWFFIEYCNVGGIGKLFRSSDLTHFITYLELFYTNMPIDWLMESYLADRVCPIDKSTKACSLAKEKIRPKYKSSLFQHIGVYSSLKGKIQKVKDTNFGKVPSFHPHTNPPAENIRLDVVEYKDHTLKRAYNGETFFWGLNPKKGTTLEIWFKEPTNIGHFFFRSGNVEHVSDKFQDTVIEVLPHKTDGVFTVVGRFDEFGLAEGDVKLGLIDAIRLKVQKDYDHWVILSEMELTIANSSDDPSGRNSTY